MTPKLCPYELSSFTWMPEGDPGSRLNFPVSTSSYPTMSIEEARRVGHRAQRVA